MHQWAASIPSSFRGRFMQITSSDNGHSIRIGLPLQNTILVWIIFTELHLQSKSTVPLGTWTHITVVYDPGIGMFVYMDGILEAFKSIDEINVTSNPHQPYDYVFGSMHGGLFHFDGIMDEIKICDSLSSAGTYPKSIFL